MATIPEQRSKRRDDGDAGLQSSTLLDYTSAGTALVGMIRSHGHLAARLDPLGSEPSGDPALEPDFHGLSEAALAAVPARALRVYVEGETLGDVLPKLRDVYCGEIAYEIEHLSSHEQRRWLREAIESRRYWVDVAPGEQKRLLIRLLRIEGFEHFLRRTFLGAKTFSIEGLDVMVLMVDELVALAAAQGVREVVFGMNHRGRLNMLAHGLRRPYSTILGEFEGESSLEFDTLQPAQGSGDVKYHLGADTIRTITVAGEERAIHLSLLPNPSHLEIVDPVVLGRTRALQTELAPPSGVRVEPQRALAILQHGDAAFPGQGVVAETLNLQSLVGYAVGGTVHLIANNQVGFTTDPTDARSTRYASDLAKGFNVPIIHVNADSVDACRAAIRLAMAFRERFARDVVIDVIGYRRNGHNEGDEPAYTQPGMYERIRTHPPIAQLYADQLIGSDVVSATEVEEMRARIADRLRQEHAKVKAHETTPEERPKAHTPGTWEADTRVDGARLIDLATQLDAVPEGFTVHPKLASQLARRLESVRAGEGIDWGTAETLAYASLVTEGVHVRLTGQDSERGTFAHRHCVLHDATDNAAYAPLRHLTGAKAGFEVHNSPLSEAACMAFEYGYSVTASDALVLWEAQFGDFVNGAEVVIDQFIFSGASKWGQTSRLALLLPHGFEGNGPEHSSARLERFLQQAAEDNITVANPTTPAQFFHLLRLQAHAPRRRPLIVMTPKGLLRLRDSFSTLEDLSSHSFLPVIDDGSASSWREDVSRLVFCSGKIYYDLQRHPERQRADEVAIVRIERLYPFPLEELSAIVASYPNVESAVWVQEEPQNMGAWRSIRHRFETAVPRHVPLSYEGRPWRASPSEGYPVMHEREQERIVRAALGL